MPKVTYERIGAVHTDEVNSSLLEISLRNNIHHYHACGGRAKCSTCRVLVVSGLSNITPRTGEELELSRNKGLPDHVRLACQTHVTGDVTVRRLVLDNVDATEANNSSFQHGSQGAGEAQQIAIMFSDIRGFTSFSENHYPYDVMHILNRYLYGVGESIHRHEGYIDKYMGDGVMALFGLNGAGPYEASRQAVLAAIDMIEELNDFNVYMREQFNETFNIGIGIHVGEVVVGEMGHPKRRQLTALGDVVNTASRIESATKTFGAHILVSEEVCTHVIDLIEVGQVVTANLKGKSKPLLLSEVKGLRESQVES
jgi:adenylate cyclase